MHLQKKVRDWVPGKVPKKHDSLIHILSRPGTLEFIEETECIYTLPKLSQLFLFPFPFKQKCLMKMLKSITDTVPSFKVRNNVVLKRPG